MSVRLLPDTLLVYRAFFASVVFWLSVSCANWYCFGFCSVRFTIYISVFITWVARMPIYRKSHVDKISGSQGPMGLHGTPMAHMAHGAQGPHGFHTHMGWTPWATRTPRVRGPSRHPKHVLITIQCIKNPSIKNRGVQSNGLRSLFRPLEVSSEFYGILNSDHSK